LNAYSLLNLLLALVCAPFLLTVINRTKAFVAGRHGPMWFQPYYELWKYFHKGAVYSRTTSWVFRAGPIVGLASVLTALTLVPFGNQPAPLHFQGDLILFAYLLGLMRFFTVLAALDTGSSFEGMGASREVLYSALAEPALILGLASVARATGKLSLSEMQNAVGLDLWMSSGTVLAAVVAALVVVFLTENARVPVDDPNTHLELTMIHEVMVLDHGGPDLGFIFYGAALKLWVLGSLIVDLILPPHFQFGAGPGASALSWLAGVLLDGAGLIALAIVVGLIESSMARLRLVRIPQLLVGAGALSALSLILGGW
jgi:formate hydrogenlyase subunit 4